MKDLPVMVSLPNIMQQLRIELKTWENLKYGPAGAIFMPSAMSCTVTVSKKAAEWAEYLLERTNRLSIVKGRINPNNRTWAEKHNGRMPVSWKERVAQEMDRYVEPTCAKGKKEWSAIGKAAEMLQNMGKGK